VAHAGHDQCAWCFFQYVKPALVAERQEMKRRRAIKKGALSPANRALISEVDLAEPQMRPDQVAAAVREQTPVQWLPPLVKEQIYGLATTLGAVDDALGEEAAQEMAKEFGAFVSTGVLTALDERVELPHLDERPRRVPQPGGATGRKGKPPITDDVRLEIAHAYESGEPVLTIARRYDVARGTVMNIAAELGVKRTTGPRPQASPAPEEAPAMPIHTRTTIEVPAPAVNGTAAYHYEVTYTVTRTETILVSADNVGHAFVNAIKALPEEDNAEIINVKRV
jgi:transposase-like protein